MIRVDLVARQPLVSGPDLVAYHNRSEVDVVARAWGGTGVWDALAYPTGPTAPYAPASGPASITATLAVTLDDATLAGVGLRTVQATLAVTLADATLSAAGGVPSSGDVLAALLAYS